MGLFSNIVNSITAKVNNKKHAETMTGYVPIFSQFGQDIYASDVVQQAIQCIVQEMKKLRPMHIREKGNDVFPILNSDLQNVLNNPNPLMTTSEFLEKITWLLFLNYNAFIIPTFYEWKENGTIKRKYESLYPILPQEVTFIEDASNQLYVQFKFANGVEFEPIRYSDIIHIKYRYSVNDHMGGDESGQPNNAALLKTLELNHQLLQGVANAMKASYAINGVVKINTMLDGGKTEDALKELETKLRNSESGFLPLDLKYEYIPIKKEIALVDDKTLKFIDEKILRQYGVPLPILTGDFTPQQMAAFYQKTLEHLIVSYSQAFSKPLCQYKSGNDKIKFYTEELMFMSIDQRIQMVKELSPTGGLFENEKRVAFGLMPSAELVGKRYMSLNWIDAAKANEYQVGKDNNDSGGADDE